MFWGYEVSGDLQSWIAESFLWAADKRLLTQDTPLVLPTKAFFTAPGGSTPDTAQALVADILRHLNMADAVLHVAPLDKLPAEYRLDYNALGDTAGTWQADAAQSLVRYDPALFHRPLSLISTLVHEVMHHVLHLQVDVSAMPGGPQAEELSTDLHCITTGFGVIELAGSEQAGWQGYMTQPSRAHALALFLRARGLDAPTTLAALPPRSAKYLRRALKYLDKTPHDVDLVRAALTSSPGNAAGRPA
jgi:hypothetical protein